MKYRMKLVLIVLVILLSLTGCAESKAKEFQENVDKFCESYDKNVISDDPLYKDIGFKTCVSALAKWLGYMRTLDCRNLIMII